MSWRSVVAPILALLISMPVLVDQASAQRPGDRGRDDDWPQVVSNWELLGSTRVGRFRVDRDTIDVSRREGRFLRIGLQAREGSIRVLEIVVVYGNNERQRINLREYLREGERTRPIDLEGRGRVIKQVEVTARAGRGTRRRAVLDVFGEEAPRDDWELLGSTRVGRIGVDRDTIDVGRREGRFESLSIAARQGSAYVLELVVVYGNNERQRINLRQRLREGERTRPIDLEGRDRTIRRIEIAARARGGFSRRTVLDVYGAEPREQWELLGEQRVDRRGDRDTIEVGRKEGRFEKIRLEVKDNDVEINDLKVFFRRGPPQDVRVRERIREGESTRPIDLRGDDRVIDRIELVYRTRGRGPRATVAVYGLKSDRRGPPRRAEWEELGCQKVGFGADRDTIRVGRQEGRFSAIRLRVERSDVMILSLRVIYERGRPDDFDVRTRIRAGDETRPLDLRGERRAIKQIDLVYSSIPSLRGSARLCADGLESEGRGGRRRGGRRR